MRDWNICLTFKAICNKSYEDLQLFSISKYHLNDFLINFITSLPSFIYWKGKNYNSILVIINCLTKMVFYKLIKIIINIPRPIKIIIDMIV